MGRVNGGTIRAALPHAALMLSAFFLGSSFVAARAVMIHSDAPALLAALRYGGSALCLAPFALALGGWRLRPGIVLAALALGAMQFGLFQLAVNTALQQIPAARGAVIFALIPIMTMLIAAASGRDRITPVMSFASVLAFVGVALAVGEAALRPGMGGFLGEALFFFAVCCGATYNAFSARLFQDHSLLALSILTMSGGVLLLTPFALLEGPARVLAGYDAADFGWLAWLTVAGGAGSMALFNYGLRKLGPTGAAIWVPLSPIAATGCGALLLGEIITPLFLVGLACAVAGPLLVSWSRMRAASRSAQASAAPVKEIN